MYSEIRKYLPDEVKKNANWNRILEHLSNRLMLEIITVERSVLENPHILLGVFKVTIPGTTGINSRLIHSKICSFPFIDHILIGLENTEDKCRLTNSGRYWFWKSEFYFFFLLIYVKLFNDWALCTRKHKIFLWNWWLFFFIPFSRYPMLAGYRTASQQGCQILQIARKRRNTKIRIRFGKTIPSTVLNQVEILFQNRFLKKQRKVFFFLQVQIRACNFLSTFIFGRFITHLNFYFLLDQMNTMKRNYLLHFHNWPFLLLILITFM